MLVLKNRKIVFSLFIALTLIAVSSYIPNQAYAHVEKSFGDINVKVALANEPPLVGDTNQIQITISKGSANNAQPISYTALDNATVTIKYGGITKTLSPIPSDDNPGEYDVTISPTQLGSYYIIMTGAIDGQTLDNGTFPLDQVVSKDAYYFPPSSGSNMLQGMASQGNSQNTNTIPGPQFTSIINQLAGDINEAKNLANSTNQNVLTMHQSYQDLKNVSDELFIVTGIGIGTGIAGIVIAVYALNRRSGSRQV